MRFILPVFIQILVIGAALSQNFSKITSGSIVNDGGSTLGVGWGDFDNDNDLDLFGANVYSENDLFFINNGNGTFTQEISGPLVTDAAFSVGGSWGDYDNDGDQDLFVAAYNQNNKLYRNDGNGFFTSITTGQIVNDGGNSNAPAWADYDNDGYLDLFVTNRNQNNFLYHNNGDGTFSKITSGDIVNDIGNSTACAWADYNDDEFIDLFVANQGGNDFLYKNNGDGTFTKILSDPIVNNSTYAVGGSWGDFDNDGDLDLFVSCTMPTGGTNNLFYQNNGDGTFTNNISGIIVNDGGASMGSGWADYDNDGDLDLFVANSSVQTTPQTNFLYQNDGSGNFTKITTGTISTEQNTKSRGAAWGDYDNDGDLDLYVCNETNTNNFLYRNDGNSNNWINIKCVGIVSNKSAIGAKVKAKAVISGNPVWQMQEVSSQTGYLSQNSLNVEFGLGDAPIIDSLIIQWPSGIVCTLTNVNVNNFYVVEESCGIAAFSTLSGKVYNDTNGNCQSDSAETLLSHRLVKFLPGPTYASTDSSGEYSAQLLPGNYSIELLPKNFWAQTCPSGNSYSVNVDSTGLQLNGYDFGNEISVFCPDLSVDISTGFVRRCFNTNYYVQYCNQGTITAYNAYVDIEFDSTLSPLSSPLAWTMVNGNIYRFFIDSITPGYCGSFYVSVYVSCNALLGSTKCVQAHIYPDTLCTAADSSWDKSSISVDGFCNNDSMACFVIFNTGDPLDGGMDGTSPYRIYENNILVSTQQFQIAGGDSLSICWPANGNTIRLEADQRPGHPGNSHPQASVELCGDSINPMSLGQITLVPEDDADDFVEIDCREVTGSYDPNDKSVKPVGLADEKYIDSTAILEYHINFQNTGTDTAFTVIIRDTLSPYLDVTTVQKGSSSHNYSFKIMGENVLEWKFENILLPDSNVNEPASHGFVKFKVEQVKFNPEGTVIENNAGIIFDFNEPVITNTTFNTIGIPSKFSFSEPLLYSSKIKIKVYPNPFHYYTLFFISGDDSKEKFSLELFNVVGQKLFFVEGISNEFQFAKGNLSNGIYFYKISSEFKLVGTGKLVIE